MKKNGFVLMETIVVISVLCTILVVLYASFSNILIKVQKKSLYDNTEYIYKAEVVRNYLENKPDKIDYDKVYVIYCQNSSTNINDKCYSDSVVNNYEKELFRFLGVEAIYFTIWDANIGQENLLAFEPTTQNYIKFLDPDEQSGYRMIVMFKQENNDTDKSIYEYASLKFGSRN